MRLLSSFTIRLVVMAIAGALALAGAASAQTTYSAGPQHAAAIQKDIAEASSIDVSGTPTFFFGQTTTQGFDGFRIVGAQDDPVFQARLDSLLK